MEKDTYQKDLAEYESKLMNKTRASYVAEKKRLTENPNLNNIEDIRDLVDKKELWIKPYDYAWFYIAKIRVKYNLFKVALAMMDRYYKDEDIIEVTRLNDDELEQIKDVWKELNSRKSIRNFLTIYYLLVFPVQ